MASKEHSKKPSGAKPRKLFGFNRSQSQDTLASFAEIAPADYERKRAQSNVSGGHPQYGTHARDQSQATSVQSSDYAESAYVQNGWVHAREDTGTSSARPLLQRGISESTVQSNYTYSTAHSRTPTSASRYPEGSVFGDGDAPWSRSEFTDSPPPDNQSFIRSESPITPTTTMTPIAEERSTELRRPPPLHMRGESFTSTASSIPPSPSRARWQHLREQVLPAPAAPEPATPSSAKTSRTAWLRPGATPSITTLRPAPAPRPSRLAARLGFRQVVNEARTAAVDGSVADEAQQFTSDVQTACWEARFVDARTRLKLEGARAGREGPLAATSFIPTFMSTTSLPATAHASTLSLPKNESSATPSVKRLHRTILHYASLGRQGAAFLPLESEVISALLVPFSHIGDPKRTVDEEQQYAAEAFEVAVKTWASRSNEAELERAVWCCKAAMAPSAPRSRLFGILYSLLFPRNPGFQASSPIIIQTLVQALFNLLAVLSTARERVLPQEIESVRDLIERVASGGCGPLSQDDVEQEYNAIVTSKDDSAGVRTAILLEALMRCVENGDEAHRRWILAHAVEAHWPVAEAGELTPLGNRIQLRKLGGFMRAALALLTSRSRATDDATWRADAMVIMRIVETRVIHEVEALSTKEGADARARAARIVLELMAVSDTAEVAREMASRWFREKSAWKSASESAVEEIVNGEWSDVIILVTALIKGLADDVNKPAITLLLPLLNDRIVSQPPDFPCQPLTDLLEYISQTQPQLFYKPLFACAASSKEVTIGTHLSILFAVSHFLPDFWTRDAEMMSVALMSNPAAGKKPQAAEGESIPWGNARLGQSVLLVELIARIQSARLNKEDLTANGDQSFRAITKFATILESRLGILLDLKEKTNLVPASQRMLFTSMFLEIRLLTRSLKSFTCLSRVLSWTLTSLSSEDPQGDDVSQALEKLRDTYELAQEGSRSIHQRRSTMLFSPNARMTFPSSLNNEGAIISTFGERMKLISQLSLSCDSSALQLLVALSALLSTDDYAKLGPALWKAFLTENGRSSIAPMCFLIMQCGEKSPDAIMASMVEDMQSPQRTTRLLAIEKIGTLLSRRFQILSQTVIVDRTHPRPFKLARPQMFFVALDIGSSHYVLDDPQDAEKDKDGIPRELRKRLQDIGWEHEGQKVDPKVERAKTPLSMLPLKEIERGDEKGAISPTSAVQSSRSGSSEGGLLLRRKSSAGSFHGSKKRAIFVPSLGVAFPYLATLSQDTDFAVASAARELILDAMRDDPTLLGRPAFDALGGEERDVSTATSILRRYMHLQEVLPPAMAHHIFNNLAGFLRSCRQAVSGDLRGYAYSMSVLAKVATQVSQMSVLELRRAKIDAFFVPSGALWFLSSAPEGPMFPRSLPQAEDPFTTLPSSLIWVTLLRVSQNMCFHAILKRKPQDVQTVRKSLSRLELPTLDETATTPPLEPFDFVPMMRKPARNLALNALSLILSRSYLLLIAQVFRCMPRHLSDRNELAVYMDGINRILLVHGDDIGIVGQAMVAVMAATTQFQRLFSSRGAYALFMPAIIKVYTECEPQQNSRSGIREAIEYSASRFYAFHEEAFVFQSLDALGPIVALPSADGEKIAKSIYFLFSTLKSNNLPSTPIAAGIRELNRALEKRAIILNAVLDQLPQQTILANLRRGGQHGEAPLSGEFKEEYEAKRLGLDNFVRLFLTVIAHDPTILRAEQFLRLLRFLTPSLYEASNSARTVLRDGIEALGMIILTRAAGKAKVPEAAQLRPTGDASIEIFSQEGTADDVLTVKSGSPSDLSIMRLDYLGIVVAYVGAGGEISSVAFQRTIEVVRTILRDPSKNGKARVEDFFADFTRASLLPTEGQPTAKRAASFLAQLAPMIASYAAMLNLSRLFSVLAELSENALYASDPLFCKIIVQKFCAAGLEDSTRQGSLVSPRTHEALVRLIHSAIAMKGADVMAELEKQELSYTFLAGVIMPLATMMKSNTELNTGQRGDNWAHEVYRRSWMRLLSLAISACERPHVAESLSRSNSLGQNVLERTKSQDKRSGAGGQRKIMTLAIALQIIKVIVVRAEDDLSNALPGIWNRLGEFLRPILQDGNGMFALSSRDFSPSPSPTQSPTTRFSPLSPMTDAQFVDAPPTPMTARVRNRNRAEPRLVDYLLWSTLELLCLRRSPLMLQLRGMMQAKTVALEQELQAQASGDPFVLGLARGRRLSVGSPFAKARRRSVSIASGASSPRTSVFAPLPGSPKTSTPPRAGLSIAVPAERRAGYDLSSPALSPGAPPARAGPKIVHLGPVRQGSGGGIAGFNFGGASEWEGEGGRLRAMARATPVRSVALVRRTYARVRLVQETMGYTRLVPAYDEDEREEGPEVKSWTRAMAAKALAEETQEMMEEFEEDEDPEFVVVEPSDSSRMMNAMAIHGF